VARDWDLPTRLHNSVWTADRSIEFLRRHDSSRPFFLAVGFQDPHHPLALPRDFADRVDEKAVPLPDYDDGELADKPPFFTEAHCGMLEQSRERGEFFVAGQGKGHDYRRVTPEAARLSRAYYYGMVRLIDQQMGRILSSLQETGLAENTLVIFTSDHGELLGDHGLWLKGPFHYEPLIRVPLMLRWPRGFSAAPATRSLVSLLDLAPTVLEAAGLEIPATMDGHSLLPLLRGQVPAVRDHALIEFVDDPRKLRLKTLVTPTRKLTWYADRDFGELYDLELDPREKINHWNTPAYAADKTALLGKLLSELERLEPRQPRRSYA
jgi:arylsulfatase A-like enzyme